MTFSLIAAVLLVYVILLIICIRRDGHDAKKGGVIQLIDNQPHDRQRYIITFETGFRRGAGTTAKVSGYIVNSSWQREMGFFCGVGTTAKVIDILNPT